MGSVFSLPCRINFLALAVKEQINKSYYKISHRFYRPKACNSPERLKSDLLNVAKVTCYKSGQKNIARSSYKVFARTQVIVVSPATTSWVKPLDWLLGPRQAAY